MKEKEKRKRKRKKKKKKKKKKRKKEGSRPKRYENYFEYGFCMDHMEF